MRQPKSIDERTPEAELSQEEINAWQLKLRAAWQKAVTSIIEVATMLMVTRKEVAHGQWGRLFEGPQAPFSSRTALMLMDIAEHKVLSNPKHASDLPCSWYCLFLLSRLSDDRVEWLIREKTIHAGLHRSEVETILRGEKSKERRARLMSPRSADEMPYPPEITTDTDFFNIREPTAKAQTPPLRDTLRNMKRLLVDMKDAQDEIRRTPYYQKHFRWIGDHILGLVEGEPTIDELLHLIPTHKVETQSMN